jgi:hypothetical protein
MKLSDIVKRLVIDHRKLTHYASDYDSPYGRHKAVLFEKVLGFTKENYESLVRQVEMNAPDTETVFHSEDRFGKRYATDIEIEGNNGRRAIIRTGWLVSDNNNEAHLVTIYVKERETCRK